MQFLFLPQAYAIGIVAYATIPILLLLTPSLDVRVKCEVVSFTGAVASYKVSEVSEYSLLD